MSRGSTGLGILAADNLESPGGVVPWASWRIVTKDYFTAMGLPLIAGRGFTEQDRIAEPWRAIISKRLADLLWPGQNPIGRTAILWRGQGDRKGEVIGVVGDMRERGLENDMSLAVYFPAYGAMDATTLNLVMHTRGKPGNVTPALRAIVSGIDPTLPVSNIRTLEIVTTLVATRCFTDVARRDVRWAGVRTRACGRVPACWRIDRATHRGNRHQARARCAGAVARSGGFSRAGWCPWLSVL